jgi:hypothetical protein
MTVILKLFDELLLVERLVVTIGGNHWIIHLGWEKKAKKGIR